MRFLLDKSADDVRHKQASVGLVDGQLLTPLTRYANWGGPFAIDNGAFSRFPAKAFRSLLERNKQHQKSCYFVAVPDVVGSARRTLELYEQRHYLVQTTWPLALVAQDGIEDLPIPWMYLQAIFIGGSTRWKESQAAVDVVKTAKILGKHVHVGRVNTWKRFRKFAELHADTCDGSGASQYDHMLADIVREMKQDVSQHKLTFMDDSTQVVDLEVSK